MATAIEVARFIAKIAPIAQEQAAKHGNKIFASVCIAQACAESAYGTTEKMRRANAIFGIKVGNSKYHFGKAWKDKAYSTRTKECYNGKTYTSIVDMFRAYDSFEEAVEDYFDMLCVASRYKAALNAADYKACIRAIAPSYATAEANNHSYSKSVIWIIEKYNLIKYDKPIDPNQCPYEEPGVTVKRPAKGNKVRWVQYYLNRHGSKLIVDGIFGQKTEDALKKFQQDHNLVPDGICGPLSRKALLQDL